MLQKPFHILPVVILLHFQSATLVQCCQLWQFILQSKQKKKWKMKLIPNVMLISHWGTIATLLKKERRQNMTIYLLKYVRAQGSETKIAMTNRFQMGIQLHKDKNFLFLRWDLIIYFWTCHQRGSTSPGLLLHNLTSGIPQSQSKLQQCCQLYISFFVFLTKLRKNQSSFLR